jgi:sugar fermentation stimulation protein A
VARAGAISYKARMRIEQPILEGRFLRRYKRFFADVELPDGTLVTAHCPNTGSLLGCLEEGRRAVLRDSQDPKRKLRYTLQAIQVGRSLVNVDTSLPNLVVHEAVLAGTVPELAGYDEVRREVPYGESSRIDLLLTRPRSPARCYVEVKSTTLAEGHTALFPDAVTTRGRKHLGELAGVVAAGHRAVQLYFISRADVRRFAPADAIDPAYGAALREAARAGVELLAYCARVRPGSLELHRRLPIEL